MRTGPPNGARVARVTPSPSPRRRCGACPAGVSRADARPAVTAAAAARRLRLQRQPPLVRVRGAAGRGVGDAVHQQRDHAPRQAERAQVVGHVRARPQRQVAQQHLERQHPQCVHVVARVGRLAVALLRAGVAEAPRGADHRRDAPAVGLQPARLPVDQVRDRGAPDAEVGHPQHAALVAQHVRGLQVAVDDGGAEPVAVADRRGDHEQRLHRLRDALGRRPPLPLAHRVGERAAPDVLVHQPRRLAAQVALQQRDDVRVVAGVLHHAHEHLLLVGDEPVPGVRVGAELDGAAVRLPLVAGEPHLAEPAEADLPFEEPARQPRHRVAGFEVEAERLGRLDRRRVRSRARSAEPCSRVAGGSPAARDVPGGTGVSPPPCGSATNRTPHLGQATDFPPGARMGVLSATPQFGLGHLYETDMNRHSRFTAVPGRTFASRTGCGILPARNGIGNPEVRGRRRKRPAVATPARTSRRAESDENAGARRRGCAGQGSRDRTTRNPMFSPRSSGGLLRRYAARLPCP